MWDYLYDSFIGIGTNVQNDIDLKVVEYGYKLNPIILIFLGETPWTMNPKVTFDFGACGPPCKLPFPALP